MKTNLRILASKKQKQSGRGLFKAVEEKFGQLKFGYEGNVKWNSGEVKVEGEQILTGHDDNDPS